MHILDGIVTEVLHQVFDKMQGASNDMIVGSAVQKADGNDTLGIAAGQSRKHQGQ